MSYLADMVFTAVMLFWMFIGTLAVGGFSFIMLMVLALFTPAMPFLKAKIRKVPILAARRTDRKIDYTPATKFIQPLAMHKEYGGFIVDPESVYSSLKGGVSILPVNSEIGITLRPQVLEIIDALKNNKIDNIDEAEWLSDHWGQCECGYKGIMGLKDGILICPIGKEVNHEVKKEEAEGREHIEEAPLYVSAKDRGGADAGEPPGAPGAEHDEDTAGAVCTSEDSQL